MTQRLETVDVIVKKLKEKPKPKGYGGKEETEEGRPLDLKSGTRKSQIGYNRL